MDQDRVKLSGESATAIAASVERAVASGELARGTLLPPVRTLAAQLGVAPATAAAAYRELRIRGIVATGGRRGTRVAARPPVASRATAPLPSPTLRDLWSGVPDPVLLPALDRFVRADHEPLYGTFAKLPELVELARAQFRADGIPAEGIAIASGTLDALERILQAHLLPGDGIAVEDPGYANVLDLVAALGLRVVPVALDDEGPLPDALETALRRGARAALVTPRAQNPTGAALSGQRARALRTVLAAYPDVLLVEDDHLGWVASPLVHTLIDRDRPRWAAYRSYSKALGPDLRTALVAGDDTTLARVEGRQLLGPGWVSHVLQRMMLVLLTDPDVLRQLEAARDRYDERRMALVEALASRGIEARGRTGFNVWIPVANEDDTVASLAARGYAVAPGQRFRIAASPGIRVTASTLLPEEAASFAEALAG